MFTAAGADVIRIPVRAPRANTIGERFVGSIRPELLDRILIVNARHATADLREYEDHFNHHRPHAGIGYVTPDDEHQGRGGAIRQARLRGLAGARQARIEYRRNTTENQP